MVLGVVEWVFGCVTTIVLEDVPLEPLERDALEVAGGHDPVGVDVVAGKWDAASDDLPPNVLLAHRSHSRTSVTSPAMAAAATMEGLMRRVRPVGVARPPFKFPLLEEGQIPRPARLSPF